MRAGAMSVLGDEHSPDLKGVLSATKMTSDGFSLLSQEQTSWGGGGEHRCSGLWGGGVHRELGAREEGHRTWQS